MLDLNVGGVTGIQVRKSVLCSVPDSMLEAMFSGRFSYKEIDGRIFIDRDPEIFKLVINYLRNDL